jgi:hypothetical protein
MNIYLIRPPIIIGLFFVLHEALITPIEIAQMKGVTYAQALFISGQPHR